jgi:predicted RNase H-like HicB family nuclease
MSAILANKAISERMNDSDWIRKEKSYKLDILVTKDEDVRDSYSAIALNLPGVASCGQTVDDALANVEEAACGVLESYIAHGIDIPWSNSSEVEIPQDGIRRRIIVNA